jgi:hypothetical protein
MNFLTETTLGDIVRWVAGYGLLSVSLGSLMLLGTAVDLWRAHRRQARLARLAGLEQELAALERQATHLEDCRRGVHRTTLDADTRTVFGERPFGVWPTIDERCVDCGLTVPFGRVWLQGSNAKHRRSHG